MEAFKNCKFLRQMKSVMGFFVILGVLCLAYSSVEAATYDKTYNFTTQTDLDNSDWNFSAPGGAGLQPANTAAYWSWDSDGTTSAGVGPLTGQDGSGYVYTEASAPTAVNDVFTMELANALDGGFYSLNFSFYVSADNEGQPVTIEADAWDGTQWNNLLNRGGNTVADWDFYDYSLDSYTNADVRVRLVVTMGATGTTWNNDIGIDTVRIYGDSRNESPLAPTLVGIPFDNARVGDSTPDISFVASDPDGAANLIYHVQVDDDPLFGSVLVDCESDSSCSVGDGSFVNSVTGGDTSPFIEDERIIFTPTTLLSDGVIYYWRVRAEDDSGSGGSGSYGIWSGANSIVYQSGTDPEEWFESSDEQFAKNLLTDTVVSGSDSVVLSTLVSLPVLDGGYTSNTAAGAASLTLTKPSGVQAGDLLLILVGNDDNTATPQWDDATLKPSGFTLINEAGTALSDAHVAAFYRIADGTEGASVAVPSQSADDYWGYYMRVTGADPLSPIDVVGVDFNSGNSLSKVVPGVATTEDNDLAFYVLASDGGDAFPFTVSGAGWSEEADVQAGGGGQNSAGTWGTKDQVVAGTTGDATVGMTVSDGASGFQFAVKAAPITTGTIVSEVVDYDDVEGTMSWDMFDWSETETAGSVSMQLYYDSGGGSCDALVSEVSLPGNSAGFASGPIDISGLNTTIYNRLCLVATLNDGGGSPELNDWMMSWKLGTTLVQNDYRWYNNSDSLTPGSARAAENTHLVALSTNDILRLRMNTTVEGADFAVTSESFKLQYGEGTNCAAITSWIDVGIAGGGSIWRGYNNATPVNGSTMPNGSYLLSTSEVAQSYQEYNNSVLNPRSTAVGYDSEWDWVIQNNGADAGTSYCFRMVAVGDTLVEYNSDSFPRVVTTGPSISQEHFHWRNDDGSGSTASSASNGIEDAIIGIPKNVTKRLRLGISNNSSSVSPDMNYRLEYGLNTSSCENISTWTDVGALGGDWDMSDSVYLTDGENTSNISIANGGVSDLNTIFVPNNQGIKDTSSETAAISLENNEFTELEYSIKASASVADGANYCFRLTDAGAELGSYEIYAEVGIGSVSAYLGKSSDGWGGVIPVYLDIGGNLNPVHYPYVRAEVTTPAPESEVYYTDMEWDSVDGRYEGDIRIGSWHCPGCVHPRAGNFDVTVQMDDDIGFGSIDFSDTTPGFSTFVTRRRSSLDNTDLSDYNPVWDTDHWNYTVKDLGLYQASGVVQNNVTMALPFHPVTSVISNITVSYDGVPVAQGDSTSTTDAWWWDDLTHTLYLSIASMPVSDNDTNLLDLDITFDSDTDLWVSRYDHLETTDMAERLFYNGLMISNKNYATFVFGGASDYGNPNWEGTGEQAESRVHEPGQDDDTMDAMERVAIHVNNNVVADGSGYYEYNIKWKQDQWKDFITSENNNQVVVVVDSDDTPGTGWVHQIDPNEQVSVKRRQAFTAGKRSITNTYEITNNHPTLTHDLPLVWHREQWLSIKPGSERELNDRARFSGDTVDRTMEQRVQINTLPEAWMAAYDDAQFVALSIIFNLDDIDGSTYGIFAVEEVLGQSTAEWPINITNPHADQWAHQIAFEHTFTGVAPGEMVKFRFAQFIADEESWIDIQNGVELEFNELNGAQPTFAQRDYRWYKDNDLVNPLEPMGVVGVLENEDLDLLATDGAPNQGDEVRLRMNLDVNTADMNFGRNSFILQYKEDTDDDCTTGVWSDVGVGEDWTFAESSIPDGTDIAGVLSSTVVAGQYAKSNPTAVTSSDALLGDVLEYDFHLRATDVNPMSMYSFRVINDDTTVLDDGYLNCPSLKTSPHTEDDLRHGLFYLPSGVEKFFFWAD